MNRDPPDRRSCPGACQILTILSYFYLLLESMKQRLALVALDEKPSQLAHQIRTVARHLDQVMSQRVRRYDLTMPQFYVLRELFNEEGITQRELSTRLNAAEPTTLVTLRRMEHCGLVLRVRDTSDGRKVNLYLAPKGKQLRTALRKHSIEVFASMRRGLTEAKISQLRTILDHLDNNLKALIEAGAWK